MPPRRRDDFDLRPDDELMLAFRSGDPLAFDVLYDRHATAVYNFARAMLRDTGAAEEVLQDTFLAVARAAPGYQPRSQFRPWLLRIARNRCLNRLQARPSPTAPLDDDSQPQAPEPSPLAHAADCEELARTRRALHRLPVEQREAILLFAIDGMSYHEVGDVLGVPLGTVKTLIHRGRAALTELLRDRS